MENKGSGLRVVSLDNYTTPTIKTSYGKPYVTFGEKNSFFRHLIDRYRGSTTNGACIQSISDVIYGKGLDATNKARKPNDWAQLLSILEPEDVKRLVFDIKCTGQCAMQIQYQGNHKSIKKAIHMPIETLAPEAELKDDEIQGYYYHPDWENIRHESEAERFSAFGTSKDALEVLYVKPYSIGNFWFAYPDWFDAIQWAEIEEEIANYYKNLIVNSFAPTMFVSMNNGRPASIEEEDKIVKSITDAATGTSNAGKVIISWADSKENENTIVAIPLSEAASQYEFLSKESQAKILVGHRITSPLLLGISTPSGFSSNAEEMSMASKLQEIYTAKPFRQILIDEGFNKILEFNNLTLDLTFASLSPFEEVDDTIDVEDKTVTEEVVEENLSHACSDGKCDNFNDEEGEEMLESLAGEVITEEWELVESREAQDDTEIEGWLNELNLAEVIKSDPNAESKLDKYPYKVRYEYKERHSSSNSRDFCKKMMSRTSRGVVYRKEDIDNASFQGVNGEFAHSGGRYSLWKYKGGVYCGHYWAENLYVLKTKKDGEYYEDKSLSSSDEKQSISDYKPKPASKALSETAPIDTPTRGAYK